MAGDDERRGNLAKPNRRDPARANLREPPVIEGAAERLPETEPSEPATTEPERDLTAATEVPRVSADPPELPASSPEIIEASEAERGSPPPAEPAATITQERLSGVAGDRAGRDSGGIDDGFVAPPEKKGSNFATVIALAIVLIAGGVIYLFYQMSFVGPDMSADVADLRGKVNALASRPQPDIGALTQRLSSAEGAVTQAGATLSALSKRVDALAQKEPAQPSLQPQVTDLQSAVGDLKRALASLQATVAGLPRPDINRIEGQLGEIEGHVATLQAVVSAIPHVDLGPLTGKVDALDARLKPLESEVAAAQSPARVAERKAAPVAVTAQAVIDAVVAGHPFPQELKTLENLGADPAKIATLQTVATGGAPTAHDLQSSLAELRDRIIAQGTPTPSGSYMDRLMSGATGLVQVRPLGSVVGDTPAAIVARMDAEIGADDFAAALADWRKLPEPARAVSKSLADRLQLRLDAESAARDIAANAIGAMAPPRG